jgi:hypothetical protein
MSLRLTEVLALLPEARREHLELLEGMQVEYLDHLEKLERRVLALVRPEA